MKSLVVCFLLAAVTSCIEAVPPILNEIYQYEQQRECAVKQLSLESITGNWYSLYYSDPRQEPYQMELSQVDDSTLCVKNQTIDGSALEPTDYKISRPSEEEEGHLNFLYPKGTATFASNWYFLTVDPQNYMTVFFENQEGVGVYVIFTRETDIGDDLYTEAIQGLLCCKEEYTYKLPLNV